MRVLSFAVALVLAMTTMSGCDILRDIMNNPSNGVYRCVPMTSQQYSTAFNLISSRTFANDRLQTAKQQTQNGRCLTAQQINQIVAILEYENMKLEYAKFAYPMCADPANYGIINNNLQYDSSKRELGRMTGVN